MRTTPQKFADIICEGEGWKHVKIEVLSDKEYEAKFLQITDLPYSNRSRAFYNKTLNTAYIRKRFVRPFIIVHELIHASGETGRIFDEIVDKIGTSDIDLLRFVVERRTDKKAKEILKKYI